MPLLIRSLKMACPKVKKTLNVWIKRPKLFPCKAKTFSPARQFKIRRTRELFSFYLMLCQGLQIGWSKTIYALSIAVMRATPSISGLIKAPIATCLKLKTFVNAWRTMYQSSAKASISAMIVESQKLTLHLEKRHLRSTSFELQKQNRPLSIQTMCPSIVKRICSRCTTTSAKVRDSY